MDERLGVSVMWVFVLFLAVAVLYAGIVLFARWWWRFGRFQPRGPYTRGFRPPKEGKREVDELALMVYGAVKAPSVGGREKIFALVALLIGITIIVVATAISVL